MAYVSKELRNKFIERFKQGVSLIQHSGLKFLECGCFGSFARNDFNCLSDIDFILIVDSVSTSNQDGFYLLRQELREIECDLAVLTKEHLDKPNTPFAYQVKRDYRRVL